MKTALVTLAAILAAFAAHAWSMTSKTPDGQLNPTFYLSALSAPKNIGFVNNHISVSIIMPDTSLDDRGKFLTIPAMYINIDKDPIRTDEGRFRFLFDDKNLISVETSATSIKHVRKIVDPSKLLPLMKNHSRLAVTYASIFDKSQTYSIDITGLDVKYRQIRQQLKACPKGDQKNLLK